MRKFLMLILVLFVLVGCSKNAAEEATPAITSVPTPTKKAPTSTPRPTQVPNTDGTEDSWAPEIDVKFTEAAKTQTEQKVEDLISTLITEHHCSLEAIKAALINEGYEDYLYVLDRLKASYSDIAVEKGLELCFSGEATPRTLLQKLLAAGFTEEQAKAAIAMIAENADWQEIAAKYGTIVMESGVGPQKLLPVLLNEGFTETEAAAATAVIIDTAADVAVDVYNSWLANGWSSSEAKALMRENGWEGECMAKVNTLSAAETP